MTPGDYISKLPTRCVLCGQKAEYHHLDAVGMGRNRNNNLSENYTVVPLCRKHHTELHNIGYRRFAERYNFDLWKWVAKSLITKIIEEKK